MLIALIPAHNEEHCITNAIQGLLNQTVVPDRILVIGDNCTDQTLSVASLFSPIVETVSTTNNHHKKAGALNQVLAKILPLFSLSDHILVTDADSVLDPTFISSALKTLEDPSYGGVGGVFRGDPGGGFIGHLQRNEYARYARDVRRLKGKCLVITGTAAVFPVHVLKEVSAARIKDGRPHPLFTTKKSRQVKRTADPLPSGDGQGGIYDTSVLTEDNELSFAIMHLGYKIHSPKGCTLTTEIMSTWEDLWKQRTRWKRGAIENCVQYGLTHITAKYWARQVFTMLGILVTFLYLVSLAATPFLGGMHVQPLWLLVSLVFVVERVVTVRDMGWRQMLLSSLMYELILDFFLQIAHAKAYADALLRRNKEW